MSSIQKKQKRAFAALPALILTAVMVCAAVSPAAETQQDPALMQETDFTAYEGISQEDADLIQDILEDVFSDYQTEEIDPEFIANLLSFGSRGSDVTDVQNLLTRIGYLHDTVDGIYGANTESSVLKFQNDYNLFADGIVGNETFDKLQEIAGSSNSAAAASGTPSFSGTNLSTGSVGSDVKTLQQCLMDLGYFHSVVDGEFGPVTEEAVRAFQRAHGLYVDGIAGRSTFGMLSSPSAGTNTGSASAASAQTPAAAGSTVNTRATLQIGSTGSDVSGLQSRLAQMGYFSSVIDGEYGRITSDAVLAYQRDHGLYADGIAGPMTLSSLYNSNSNTVPSGSAVQKPETITIGGTYIITNAGSNSVVDVSDASVQDGANVQLYAPSGEGHQKWVLQSAGNGYYYLRNLHSWKVLELADGNVLQGDADGSAAQLWKITEDGSDGYRIVNAGGQYLDAASGNVNAGSQKQGTSQKWLLQEVDPGTALDFKRDGTQYIGIRSFQVSQGNVTETSDYYNLQTNIDLPSGGYSLSGGSNYSIGLKVMYVTRYLANAGYLGWNYYNYNRYDDATAAAVARFQRDHGLEADGVVGEKTWEAMGYSSDDFYHLGDYTTDLKVDAYGSDRETYVNAMMDTAQEYYEAGTGFSDGASGRPGTYIDCSGLIFQCLYAAGINPSVNIIDHARVVYEYTSRNLGTDARMGQGAGSAQRGDLIFYGGNTINHVGIYAGNGMIYDSTPGNGVKFRSIYSGGNILRIVRVF